MGVMVSQKDVVESKSGTIVTLWKFEKQAVKTKKCGHSIYSHPSHICNYTNPRYEVPKWPVERTK